MYSRQFIATFPAGWSPQKGSFVRDSYPKWPKHSGEGFLISLHKHVFNMAIRSKHRLREFASKILGNFKKYNLEQSD